jgi:ComF family protein
MRSVVCSMSYRGTPAAIVTGLKDAHELRLAPLMAAAIATSLDEASAWDAPDGLPRFDPSHVDALCFVPATSAAFARRGFDHMELVARELSWLLSLPVADVLVREEGMDQRTLGRDERARNLEGTVGLAGDVEGLSLLLVDDVITTGASVCACAKALLEGGAKSVSACALARVW